MVCGGFCGEGEQMWKILERKIDTESPAGVVKTEHLLQPSKGFPAVSYPFFCLGPVV